MMAVEDRAKISVLINTLNEERNLPYALRSVRQWADEIIVVDMYSTDRTVEIAHEFGAKVFFHERVTEFEIARKLAIEKASNDWMFFLDADELVPLALARRLLQIAHGDAVDVVRVPRLNYLIGAAMQYSGWGPNQDKQYRLFRRGKLGVRANMHDHIEVFPGAKVHELSFPSDGAIIHFSYLDFEHFITKLNRYTNIHALQAAKAGEHPNIARALFKATRKFLAYYLLRKGYRDGWRGIYLALLMFFYEVSTFAKLTQLRLVGDKEDIQNMYVREAERYLSEYVEC
jgi:glycosyltransferase involved in cell wall biosynthesis